MNNLFFYLYKIMIRIIKLKFHVIHHYTHLSVHGNSEKHRLSVIYYIFTPVDEKRDVLAFFIKILQF